MAATDNMGMRTLSTFYELFMATRLEMCLFLAAVLAYFALFGNVMPKLAKQKSKLKVKSLADDDVEEVPSTKPLDKKEQEAVEKAHKTAYENGDHRSVVRHWNTLKRSVSVPAVSLSHTVESVQRVKKDKQVVLRELKAHFKKFPKELGISTMNDVLDSVGKCTDSDLMESIVETFPALNLEFDQRTYEIFLNVYFMSRSFESVNKLVARMKSTGVPFTTRATITVIKTALKTSNFAEARSSFRNLKAAWTGLSATPSAAPRHIVSQIVELACKEHQLREFLPELNGAPISEEVVSLMLNECIWQRDETLTCAVEQLARDQALPFTDRLYALLLKSYANDSTHGRRIFQEVLERDSPLSTDLIVAAIAFCSNTSDVERAEQLKVKAQPLQVPVLSAFIRFYVDAEQFEKACDLYEEQLTKLKLDHSESKKCLSLDARLERVVMNAALRCGRSSLATGLLDSSPSDVAKHIAMIRNFATENNLQGAVDVFESLKRNGVEMNSIIYNTVIDACVECGQIQSAEQWMAKTKSEGMADVVSYNTLIKAQLANGNFRKVRGLMDEMRNDGLQPNRVTFNELINAVVTKDSNRCGHAAKAEMWALIDEMQDAGVKPNQVTCSILMKSLNSSSSETEVLKTMDLISNMDEPMDEVLLSSVVEACVRIGKPDLVSSKLQQVQGSGSIAVNGSHTFGSLIKAYGFAKDMDGAWRCWKEMRSRHIRPTSVTLGCMVEAVVNNGDPEGAFELIHQISEDGSCRDVLNSVIYCSVLKGFARQKMVERAWAVYEEMCKRNVELSIVTYNTLIDACARSGRMDRMQNIMDDMTKFGIRPNLITYSTMLKGHCQAGDIQTAFKLLRQMKNESKFKPDEIMYNSLLDGCAQAGLVDEGLRLLEEMKTENVLPSNFTLSVLVKLMSRARRLDSAFEVVENITKEFNFRPNVHVYTNLAQACISNRSLNRAMGVLETMLQQRIAPENRTYAILIRASLAQGLPEQAGGLLRGALRLRGAVPFLAASPLAECRQLDSALVNETLVGIAEHNKDMGLDLLADIRQEKPKVRIEVSTQRSLMMESNRGDESKQQQRTRPPHRGPATRNGANACREPRGPISRRPH